MRLLSVDFNAILSITVASVLIPAARNFQELIKIPTPDANSTSPSTTNIPWIVFAILICLVKYN
ncbi:hypothetical protein H8B06_06180 [Sphingobacterium sp. DN00404]|uniref:Uncharacterized protein n=1 Tax=Sphingobacterium micropteri TaxID=2763501 RepID=A0ABR7YM45_9SPHI|nr:hypothetical protein [Sphingobacterium micropteri]MBD1432405.1 hypothetical protein [Sphingobacterium micropteri]